MIDDKDLDIPRI